MPYSRPGSQGAAGAQGAQGAAGAQGAQGSAGAAGAQGAQGAQGASGASTEVVAQVGHGFTLVGTRIRRQSSTTSYVKAQADSAENAEFIGTVTAIADANNFTYQPVGPKLSGFVGLTDGAAYFLDPTTPGAATETEPSTAGQVSKPVGIAISATELIQLPQRGVVISAVSTLADDAWAFDTKFGTNAGRIGYAAGGWTAGPNGVYTDNSNYTNIGGPSAVERYLYRALPGGVLVDGEFELRVQLRVVPPNPVNNFSGLHVNFGVGNGAIIVTGALSGSSVLHYYIDSGTSLVLLGAHVRASNDELLTITIRRRAQGVDTPPGGHYEVYGNGDLIGTTPWSTTWVAAAPPGPTSGSGVYLGDVTSSIASDHAMRFYRAAMRNGVNALPVSTGVAAGGWLAP